MAKRVTVVISGNPTLTHRPVEALRIALGLCAGEHKTTVVLLGDALRLLTDDIDEIVDSEVLERYRPMFQQLGVPFVLEEASAESPVLPGFSVDRHSPHEIRSIISSAERTLVFA